MSPFARIRGNVTAGVLSLAAAIAVYIVTRLFIGAIAAFVQSALSSSVSLLTLHTVVLPAIGYVFDGVIAILALLGCYLVRSGRWALPAHGSAKLNLATMALLVGAGAIVARALLVITAGYTSALSMSDLRVVLVTLDLIMTVALGLFLFWVLDAAGLVGPPVVGIVALVLTGVGSVIIGLARYVPRRAGAPGVTSAEGLLIFLIGLFLWLAAYLWGYGTLRSRRPSREARAPSGEGTDR